MRERDTKVSFVSGVCDSVIGCLCRVYVTVSSLISCLADSVTSHRFRPTSLLRDIRYFLIGHSLTLSHVISGVYDSVIGGRV